MNCIVANQLAERSSHRRSEENRATPPQNSTGRDRLIERRRDLAFDAAMVRNLQIGLSLYEYFRICSAYRFIVVRQPRDRHEQCLELTSTATSTPLERLIAPCLVGYWIRRRCRRSGKRVLGLPDRRSCMVGCSGTCWAEGKNTSFRYFSRLKTPESDSRRFWILELDSHRLPSSFGIRQSAEHGNYVETTMVVFVTSLRVDCGESVGGHDLLPNDV